MVGLQVAGELGFAHADGAADVVGGKLPGPAQLPRGVQGNVEPAGDLVHRQHVGGVRRGVVKDQQGRHGPGLPIREGGRQECEFLPRLWSANHDTDRGCDRLHSRLRHREARRPDGERGEATRARGF